MPSSRDKTPGQQRTDGKKSNKSKGEVVTFPKTDLRRLADGVNHWKRTGKLYDGAPD